MNDRERLFRAIVGRKALERSAASSRTISRFETETPANENSFIIASKGDGIIHLDYDFILCGLLRPLVRY